MIRAIARVVRADAQAILLDVPGWPAHRPGQFAMLSLDPRGLRLDPLLPRPMAVFRAEGGRVEFRFRVVGRGTALLAALSAGDEVGVLGPLGNGFAAPEDATARPVLVGGGTGTASLYELAAQLGRRARVLLGGRTRDAILALADFEALPAELQVATEDGSSGRRGLVTDLLALEPGDRVFACGPTAMMDAVRQRAHADGVPCQVSLESQMACGFGICLGCAVPTDQGFRYVCTHGPVFDAERLDWKGLP